MSRSGVPLGTIESRIRVALSQLRELITGAEIG